VAGKAETVGSLQAYRLDRVAFGLANPFKYINFDILFGSRSLEPGLVPL
jgi:hypothetical protein